MNWKPAGFSDKLASLSGVFGAGSYFAEDPEKIDQHLPCHQVMSVFSCGFYGLHMRLSQNQRYPWGLSSKGYSILGSILGSTAAI